MLGSNQVKNSKNIWCTEKTNTKKRKDVIIVEYFWEIDERKE